MSNSAANCQTSKSTKLAITSTSFKVVDFIIHFFIILLFLGFTIPQRWITVGMGFLGIFNAFAMRVCLSIAITEMTLAPNDTHPIKAEDSYHAANNLSDSQFGMPKHLNVVKYDWNEKTQGLILSSFYWGFLITNVLGGVIIQKIGSKHALGLGILSTSLFTLLTPYCISWGGSTSLIVLRAAMGFGEGAIYPAVTHLLAHWIPENERSKAGSVAFSGKPLGTMFGLLMSGIILERSKIGWPMVFYFYGMVGVLSFLLNIAFCYSRPSENPYISDAELTYLSSNLNNVQTNLQSIPWRCMLRSPAVWATIIAKLGSLWGHVTIFSDMPKYMKSILKLSVRDNGYFSSIPYLSKWICALLASWIFDKAITGKKLSVTTVRKIGCAVASFGPAIFLVAASYAGRDVLLIVALQSVGVGLLGCIFCSVFVNALDLSPNYASSIMGLGNGVAVIGGVISPYVVGVMTPNQTIDEWRLVFWMVGAIFVASCIVFLIYGSGKVQEWNDPAFLNVNRAGNTDGTQTNVELLPLNKC